MTKLFPDPVAALQITPLKPAKVSDLIAYLQTLDPDLLIAHQMFSEQCLLEIDDLKVVPLCLPRVDGWVQNERPDMETQDYLLFPGN